jgi:hypothetical protein
MSGKIDTTKSMCAWDMLHLDKCIDAFYLRKTTGVEARNTVSTVLNMVLIGFREIFVRNDVLVRELKIARLCDWLSCATNQH